MFLLQSEWDFVGKMNSCETHDKRRRKKDEKRWKMASIKTNELLLLKYRGRPISLALTHLHTVYLHVEDKNIGASDRIGK